MKGYVPQRYQIRKIGDDVLRLVADDVAESDFGSEKLAKDIKRLYQANRMAGGLGVCSPQVGDSRRIFVWDDRRELGRGHIINPRIVIDDRYAVTSMEGCLSLPNRYFKIPRSFKVTVAGRDVEGNLIEEEAQGLFARLLQHEIDHLNGVLITDRLDDEQWSEFCGEYEKRTGKPCPGDWRQELGDRD